MLIIIFLFSKTKNTDVWLTLQSIVQVLT